MYAWISIAQVVPARKFNTRTSNIRIIRIEIIRVKIILIIFIPFRYHVCTHTNTHEFQLHKWFLQVYYAATFRFQREEAEEEISETVRETLQSFTCVFAACCVRDPVYIPHYVSIKIPFPRSGLGFNIPSVSRNARESPTTSAHDTPRAIIRIRRQPVRVSRRGEEDDDDVDGIGKRMGKRETVSIERSRATNASN